MPWLFLVLVCPLLVRGIPPPLVAELLDHLQINFCIFLLDQETHTPELFRVVSNFRARFIIMDEQSLIEHILKNGGGNAHKEIVIGSLESHIWHKFVNKYHGSYHMKNIKWLMITNGNPSSMYSLMRITIRYDCQFIIAIASQEDDHWHLWEVFNSRLFKSYVFAEWSQSNGLEIIAHPYLYKRRYDFVGLELNMLRFTEELCLTYPQRVHVELWKTMGSMMNFTAQFLIDDFADYLTYQDATSEVTAFHANALMDDPTLLDSMAPIWTYFVYMYIRHEGNEFFGISSYIQPFDYQVWRALGVWILVSSTCLLIIAKLMPPRLNNNVIECGFTAIDSLCNQSGSEGPEGASERFAALLTRFLAVAIFPSYSGFLISFLTAQRPEYPFHGIVDLLEDDGDYKIGAINNTFPLGFFNNSQHPLAQRVSNELFEKLENMPLTVEEGILKICRENFVFLSFDAVMSEIEKTPCPILRIPEPIFRTFAGMHLGFESEYRRVFNYNLLIFYESGILKRLTKKYKTSATVLKIANEVEFIHIRPLFVILLFGIFAALIFYTVEKLVFIRKRCSRKKSGRSNRRRNIFKEDDRPLYYRYDGLWLIVPTDFTN